MHRARYIAAFLFIYLACRIHRITTRVHLIPSIDPAARERNISDTRATSPHILRSSCLTDAAVAVVRERYPDATRYRMQPRLFCERIERRYWSLHQRATLSGDRCSSSPEFLKQRSRNHRLFSRDCTERKSYVW